MSRNKKKKKIAGQNLSLTERLERHWNNEKWEAFFSLYMRDREASDRGPWAAKFPDALYNCLTASLFLHRNYDGARQVAEMMLGERALGPDEGVLRECARTALDFINIKEGKLSRPGEEGRGIALPEPYEELRRKLADEFASPPKRGKKKKEVSNPTVEKLAKQFNALPSAKNLGPYTNFLKTAETLTAETEGTESAAIFKAVRDIASIIREMARGSYGLRDPAQLIWHFEHFGPKEYPLRASHPALLAMWEYMCKLGGRKFGGKWENAARTARMSVISMNEEFKPIYDKLLTAVKKKSSNEDIYTKIERSYDGWTDQERFIILFLAVSAHQMENDPDFLEDIHADTMLRWFKILGEIGGRRRSEGAWPESVKLSVEKMAIAGGSKYLDFLAGENLPYECMTSATIAAMVLYAPHAFKLIKARLTSRLPLNMTEADEEALDNFLPGIMFSVPVLTATSGLFDSRGKEIFFKSILMSILRTDISWALAPVSYGSPLWSSMSQPHIALFLENLPEDSYAAAFCRLCLGRKPMSLSDDASQIAAFFSSRPEESLFNATLSLFLMTWPGISIEFLLRLFENSLAEHELIGEWQAIPGIISKIQNPRDRHDIAQGVLRIIKKKYKKNINVDMLIAVKNLGILERKGKLPDNDIVLEQINKNMSKLFKRFGGEDEPF
ncbi:MAG: hypothetical protein LBS53_05100 [Synergistaceae bacterium]|nr:hypothetical protein [Synergistaceae bacterium]